MQGVLHDLLLQGDRVIPHEGDEVGAALHLFLFVDQPSLDGGGFLVQCRLDLV